MEAEVTVELFQPAPAPAPAPPPQVALSSSSVSLSPQTPNTNKESAALMSNFTSPITLLSSSPGGIHSDSHRSREGSPPCTPKRCVFDPFAPGPDKLILAPDVVKDPEVSRSFIARHLCFESSSFDFVRDMNCELEEQQILTETAYDSLSQAIVFKRSETAVVRISTPDPSLGGLKTPLSAPRLNGIVDTCPGAPLKPAGKLRSFGLGLCRKLEF